MLGKGDGCGKKYVYINMRTPRIERSTYAVEKIGGLWPGASNQVIYHWICIKYHWETTPVLIECNWDSFRLARNRYIWWWRTKVIRRTAQCETREWVITHIVNHTRTHTHYLCKSSFNQCTVGTQKRRTIRTIFVALLDRVLVWK